jgi:hypothetical protein
MFGLGTPGRGPLPPQDGPFPGILHSRLQIPESATTEGTSDRFKFDFRVQVPDSHKREEMSSESVLLGQQETVLQMENTRQADPESDYVNLNPEPRKSIFRSRKFIASASVGFAVVVSVIVVASIFGRSRLCGNPCALPSPPPPTFVYARYRSCR